MSDMKTKLTVAFENEDTNPIKVEVTQSQKDGLCLLLDFLCYGDIESLALDSEIDRDRFKVRALAFLELITDDQYNKLENHLTELDS